MKALLQRVRRASVEVGGSPVGAIDRGLVVFLGIGAGDTEEDAERLADKVVELRIFPDDEKPMNRSLRETAGEVLLVSQFTLYADSRRGRRPSFEAAEKPDRAEELCRAFARELARQGFPPREGVFGTHMIVHIENDGPVTILLDTAELARPRSTHVPDAAS